jgi:predicted nucleotidyltransferase
MLQVKPRIRSKESILEIVQGLFPNTKVMFIYYCGSLAFGISDENSDDDVTVVLDGFKGNVHLSLGELDIFAYGRDIYLKKQNLDPSVPLYDRAYID